MKLSDGLIITIVLILSSCVRDIDIEPGYKEKVVVNCLLYNDTVQKLSITKSVKITDSYTFLEIRDADITLYKENEVVGKFSRVGYDNWRIKYTPIAGSKYSLKVVLSNGTTLTASTTMPARTQINPSSTPSTYVSKYFRQYSADWPLWIYALSTSQVNVLKPSPDDGLLTEIGTNHPYVDNFTKIGSLSAYVNESTTPAYKRYIRISEFALNSDPYIEFCIQAGYSNTGFIMFRTASAEYDKYLKSSIEKIIMVQNEDDPVQWFDEESIYTNIVNGSGIFGAYYEQYILTRR